MRLVLVVLLVLVSLPAGAHKTRDGHRPQPHQDEPLKLCPPGTPLCARAQQVAVSVQVTDRDITQLVLAVSAGMTRLRSVGTGQWKVSGCKGTALFTIGLVDGDVIQSVEGVPIERASQLAPMWRTVRGAGQVDIVFTHKGQVRRVMVGLGP